MKTSNARRKKWAFGKIEEIQKTFKDRLLDEEKLSLIQNAKTEIEIIYEQYATEISIAYNQDIEVEYYCFSKVIDSYPKLDFENHAKKLVAKLPLSKKQNYDF